MSTDRISVGMVGLGGWGKNLLRNYGSLPQAELRYACDSDAGRREAYAAAYPGTTFTDDFQRCWTTRHSTPWCSQRPCRSTTRWPARRSRRAST